jgi:MarR family transcriptional regulator, organic hydroperoxide resistance regulator
MSKSKVYDRTEKSVEELSSTFPTYEVMQVAWTFSQAYNIFATSFAMTLKKKHLTISQWIALSVLFMSPKPITPTRIKSFIPIETPSVSALLDRLEERNLILRKRSKKDKRKVDVYLTESGYQVLKEVTPSTGALLTAVYGPVSQRKCQSLISVSKEVRNNCLASFGLDYAKADVILEKFVGGISIDGQTADTKSGPDKKKLASPQKRKTLRK